MRRADPFGEPVAARGSVLSSAWSGERGAATVITGEGGPASCHAALSAPAAIGAKPAMKTSDAAASFSMSSPLEPLAFTVSNHCAARYERGSTVERRRATDQQVADGAG